MTEQEKREFNFRFKCFPEQGLMLSITCCILMIKLQIAAVKDAFDDVFGAILRVKEGVTDSGSFEGT